MRRQRRAWELDSGNDFPTVTESPLPLPSHALPNLNAASAPGQGPSSLRCARTNPLPGTATTFLTVAGERRRRKRDQPEGAFPLP